jgi:hypothetical protein
MKRNSLANTVFLAGVAAGPFVKLYLERRGTSTALAWAGGFAVLALSGVIFRLMHGAPTGG